MEKPVFILGSHKSGTSLLRSLLDGVEELFVIPVEAHFFLCSGYWVDYALGGSLPKELSFDELVERFIQFIRRSNEAVLQTGDSILTGCWDIDRFVTYLRAKGAKYCEKSEFRGFLDSYVEAIHVSLYGKLPVVNRFVEKSVENAEFAAVLKKLYPDAKFVHVLRNPYATLVSTRKHVARMTRRQYPFLGNILAALENSYYYLYKNPLLVTDYRVIRYEDLVTSPREIMQSVARFIEIEFTETLLEPTVMGVRWGGNSTSGERFKGISARPLLAWQKEITSLEIEFVNRRFGHVLRDYGYERLETKASIYRPFRGEKPRTYLANRLLWKLALVARSHLTFT